MWLKVKKHLSVIQIIIFVVIFLIWLLLLSGQYIDSLYSSPANRGAFGDKFGFANALFSALALAGVIYSIILQQKELKETREEFIEQNFQTGFFNLLKTQGEISKDIQVRFYNRADNSLKEFTGKKIFNVSDFYFDQQMSAMNFNFYPNDQLANYHSTQFHSLFVYYKIDSDTFQKFKEKNVIEKTKELSRIFFSKIHFSISHYFRHLYNIFKYLENVEIERLNKASNNEEKEHIKHDIKSYANLVQAQMSTGELFLIYYNSLLFPKFKRLLIKYNVLDNLYQEDLLDISHLDSDFNLKSRKELFSI